MMGKRKKGPSRRPKKSHVPRGWHRRPCPRPDKDKLMSETVAYGVLYRLIAKGKADLDLHVYRCEAGTHWHIGHSWRLRRELQKVGLVA